MVTTGAPGNEGRFQMQDGSRGVDHQIDDDSKGDFAYNVTVSVPAGAKGKVRGLCGNFDGNRNNDFAAPDGRAIALAPPKAFQPDGTNLATTWMVPDNRNLFVCGASCAGFK